MYPYVVNSLKQKDLDLTLSFSVSAQRTGVVMLVAIVELGS